MEKKRDFLVNVAYWAVIAGAVYLGFEYLLPVSVPFILGILIAYFVVRISRRFRCTHPLFRIALIVVIYGLIGLGVAWVVTRTVALVSGTVRWLPQFYELKLMPFVTTCYGWAAKTLQVLDPAVITALQSVMNSVLSSLKSVITYLSGAAVDFVTWLATGIPSLILSLLAMIFSTVFVAKDYEKIKDFAVENTPPAVKKVLTNIRIYLTETLFVVIRSYAAIMLLTFTELSILFSLFGIEHAVLKASVIALLDILPILGTGGIMIPWAATSLVLGYTRLGIELFVIYAIVTVIRNYVEPKIVGTQLGLHPIITLVSMFIGLRLFGFFGLFGLPVGISFLWKQKIEKEAAT